MDLSTALASIEFFYRRTYWDAPTAITRSTPDYTLTYSGVTWLHSINQLWLHHPEALDNRLLGRAAQFFREYGAEYSVIFESAIRLAPFLMVKIVQSFEPKSKVRSPLVGIETTQLKLLEEPIHERLLSHHNAILQDGSP